MVKVVSFLNTRPWRQLPNHYDISATRQFPIINVKTGRKYHNKAKTRLVCLLCYFGSILEIFGVLVSNGFLESKVEFRFWTSESSRLMRFRRSVPRNWSKKAFRQWKSSVRKTKKNRSRSRSPRTLLLDDFIRIILKFSSNFLCSVERKLKLIIIEVLEDRVPCVYNR